MMFDSDSVGGADDSRNGFSRRTPVNVVDTSALMVESLAIVNAFAFPNKLATTED
jgi:hypothetical protein